MAQAVASPRNLRQLRRALHTRFGDTASAMVDRLGLEWWEKGTDETSSLAIRSATTESTYFALVDASGKPMKRTFRVVLTPGGLSAS